VTNSKRVAWFLIITFGWSWLFWWPEVFVAWGWLPKGGALEILSRGTNPAPWGPLVGALAVAFMDGGLASIGRLLRRGIQLRFSWIWFAVIFGIFPLLIGGALLLSVLQGEPLPTLTALQQPAILPIVFLVILFMGGPLQEEFGWRGTLLDPLQERFGALIASLMVGVTWGIWHLPLFFIPSQDGIYYERPIWGLIVTTTLISVLFTWVYNSCGRSIAAVLLLHTMFNFTHYLLPTLQSDIASLYLFAGQFIAAVLVVWLFGAKRLTRVQLP